VSNRKIAKALGVGETSVRRDAAPNGAPTGKKASRAKGGKAPPAPIGAPALTGAAADAETSAPTGKKASNTNGKKAAPAEISAPMKRRCGETLRQMPHPPRK
jgi:hypothetical protein